MKKEEIISVLTDYICTTFEIGDDPDFSVDVNLFDYGFVDSLQATQIVLFVEERFGIEITQSDIVRYPMNSVAEIAEVVAHKLA